VTAWWCVQGRKVRWVEDDEWDDIAICARSDSAKGLHPLRGNWTFAASAGGTQTVLAVDFELELPLAGALLSNLLKVLVRKNLESMLGAIRGGWKLPLRRRALDRRRCVMAQWVQRIADEVRARVHNERGRM